MLRIEFLLCRHFLWGWWVYFSLKNDSLVTFLKTSGQLFFSFFASHCSVLHRALLPLRLLFTICSLSFPKNCCLVNMASYNACSPLFSHLCVFVFGFFFSCTAWLCCFLEHFLWDVKRKLKNSVFKLHAVHLFGQQTVTECLLPTCYTAG